MLCSLAASRFTASRLPPALGWLLALSSCLFALSSPFFPPQRVLLDVTRLDFGMSVGFVLRSSRLLPHHGKKLSQLHGAPHDAFDGQELEKGVTFPDLELMRGCIEKPRDRVASALSTNVVGLLIYLHVAHRINMA